MFMPVSQRWNTPQPMQAGDFMSALKSSTAGSPWLALLPHSPQNSSPAKAYCTPLASRGLATQPHNLLMEDAMTKAIDPSATSNGNQHHNAQRRLTTLGLVAKQLATDDLLGQGLLLRALGF